MIKKLLIVLLALIFVINPVAAGCPALWNDPSLTCITTTNWHDFVNNWTYQNTSIWNTFGTVTNGVFFQNGTRPMTASANMGGYNVTGVGAPVSGNDAITLTYFNAHTSSSGSPLGVKWNTTSSSPALTHIDQYGNLISPTTADFNNHIVWGGMRRCDLSDTGVINAWYGDPGFSYTGSKGQVMVWVPKFWYRAEKNVATGSISYWISGYDLAGYKLHPAFITNGKELAGFYIGAFEGSAYNTTAGTYITNDAGGVNFSATTGYKLSSVSGVKPMSGKNNTGATLPGFRVLAQNRGAGWQLQNFNQVSAIELLYLIEYGSFYSQSVLSNGVTDITNVGSTNMAVNTGFTAGVGTGASDLGNASGQVTITHYQTSQTTHPFSYRGIENLYGNIWKWVDGINIKGNNNPWIADNGFVSDQFSAPYVDTGLTLLASNDYVSQVAFNARLDYGFLAATGSGSSSTYLTDYYLQSTGNLSAFFGGTWYTGTNAGAFNWYLNNAAPLVSRSVGARLAFFA